MTRHQLYSNQTPYSQLDCRSISDHNYKEENTKMGHVENESPKKKQNPILLNKCKVVDIVKIAVKLGLLIFGPKLLPNSSKIN